MARSAYWRRKRWQLALLLPALLLRALIPAGFMPAQGAASFLEICPEGFPRQLLELGTQHQHHHHGGASQQGDHCAFGGSGIAPPSQLPAHAVGSAPLVVAAFCATPGVACVRLVHLPEPRGPPAA